MYKEMLRATSQKMVSKKCSSGMEADNLLGYVSRPQPASFSLGRVLIPGHVSHCLTGLSQGPDPKLGQPVPILGKLNRL